MKTGFVLLAVSLFTLLTVGTTRADDTTKCLRARERLLRAVELYNARRGDYPAGDINRVLTQLKAVGVIHQDFVAICPSGERLRVVRPGGIPDFLCPRHGCLTHPMPRDFRESPEMSLRRLCLARRRRVMRAVILFTREKGRYPSSVAELLKEDLLGPDDLTCPSSGGKEYFLSFDNQPFTVHCPVHGDWL